MKTLLRLHRGLGMMACLGILCWGLSGFLHPIMSHLQPQAAHKTPPPQQVLLANALPLSAVLKQHGIFNIVNAHVVSMNDNQFYQVLIPGRAVQQYFNIQDGSVLADGDRRYAEVLARHYINDFKTPIQSIELVQHYTDEYNFVNRLLPVYQVRFNRPDGMRAYVETSGSRLGTLVDNTKGQLSRLFQNLHTWAFLEAFPALKLLMLVFLGAAFFSSLTGLWLYGGLARNAGQRLKTMPLRRFHRTLGIIVSLTTLTFTTSGAYHLLHGFLRPTPPPSLQTRFSTSELAVHWPAALQTQSITNLGLARVQQRVYYQVTATPPQTVVSSKDAEHHLSQSPTRLPATTYLNALNGSLLVRGDETNAIQLATAYSGLPIGKIKSTELITHFTDEYGFIFKRLPVFRIAYDTPEQDVYFIETSSGQLAAHLKEADRQEGLFFAWVHKWAFAGPYTDIRDVIVSLFALFNAVVAISGLLLFFQTRRGTKPPKEEPFAVESSMSL